MVYLVTISRVLPGTDEAADLMDTREMTREGLAEWIRDAFNNPVFPSGKGFDARPAKRPRARDVVEKLVVFQEAHADGEPHYHVAVKLHNKTMRWGSVKTAMRERYRVACHFSSSHTQLWSCIRYGFVASAKKPDVDKTPFMWAGDETWPTGLAMPGSKASKLLWEASQRPWNAGCWAARSAQTQKHMAETGKGKAKYDKLDLFALILDNNFTKVAQIIAHGQESGTEAMQKFVCKNMKEMEQWLKEAEVWGAAAADAQSLKETDWAVVCRHAEAACPCEGACTYEKMATDFGGSLGFPPSGFRGAVGPAQARRLAPRPPEGWRARRTAPGGHCAPPRNSSPRTRKPSLKTTWRQPCGPSSWTGQQRPAEPPCSWVLRTRGKAHWWRPL